MEIKKFITDYLDSIEWNYEDKDTYILFGIHINEIKIECVVDILKDIELLIAYSIIPNRVPEKYKDKIAEFITRANYGLRIGNFEMDYKDGEVRYKTYQNYDNDCINVEVLKHLIHANIKTTEKYYLGFAKIIYAEFSPEEAINFVEKDENPDEQDISDLLNLLKDN